MIIAGTGHRPKYCPCNYDEGHPWLRALKEDLKTHLSILHIQSNGDLIVRAGGAIGWDTWLAQVALDLDLDLVLYLPFPGQAARWPQYSRDEYDRIKSKAGLVNYTDECYYPKVFFDRDKAMITGVDLVVSLLDPGVERGGTFYTVGEAKKMNIPVTNFWRE
jgi:uncharacterized phage-like protein YoqJ